MKVTLKRSTLAVLIVSSLSTFAYAQTKVNVDGSFMPSEEEFNEARINKKINELLSDGGLTKTKLDGSSTSVSGNDYYPIDGSNNPIAENTVVEIDGLNDSGANVYGGYAYNSTVHVNNTNVVMKNGTVNFISGAESSSSVAAPIITTGNVYMVGGKVNGDIQGAHSDAYGSSTTAIATGNIYMTGGDVDYLYGAYSDTLSSFGTTATATGNVYLLNGKVVGMHGAFSEAETSTAIGNVYMIGGEVDHISGAYSESYTNSANTGVAIGNVYITGGKIAGNIYGAYSESSSLSSVTAAGNVYLYGDVKLQDDRSGITQYNTSIWGGYLDGTPASYNVFNSNQLSVASVPLTVKTIGNFANYDFYFNQYNTNAIKNNTALLTITDAIQNNNTVVNDGVGGMNTEQNTSKIRVAGISGDGIVSKGKIVTLIDASKSNVSFIQGDSSTDTVSLSDLFSTKDGDSDIGIKVGLVGEADVTYGVDATNNKITATIADYRVSQNQVNLNVKPLAEGRLAGLQNAVRSADMLLDVMGQNEERGSFTPIAAISGGINKYKSGSHIDSRDYRLMVGSRYQILDNLYAGLAFDYGRSNYDTYNDGDIHGSGHTYNYGMSLFTKYTNSVELGDIYLDGAFRFGRTNTTFDSNDIVTGDGDTAHYRSKVNYLGAHIGAGFIYNLDEINSFDTSIRYLWTRLGDDSVVLDGDKVNFEKSSSSRVQFKEQYNYKTNDDLTFSLAGVYEYEFDGEADANVSGVSVNAPSVKGSTGIMELGIKGTPMADNKDLSFNVNFKGYAGKRKGASAAAFVEYNF